MYDVPNPWDEQVGYTALGMPDETYERRRVTWTVDVRVPDYAGRTGEARDAERRRIGADEPKILHYLLPAASPDEAILRRLGGVPGSVVTVERPDGTSRTYLSGHVVAGRARKGPKRRVRWAVDGYWTSATVYYREEPAAADPDFPYEIWSLP